MFRWEQDGDGLGRSDDDQGNRMSRARARMLERHGVAAIVVAGRFSSFSGYRLTLEGEPGFTYRIETSDNLLDWSAFTNATLSGVSAIISDVSAAVHDLRQRRDHRVVDAAQVDRDHAVEHLAVHRPNRFQNTVRHPPAARHAHDQYAGPSAEDSPQ